MAGKKKKKSELKRVYRLVRFSVAAQLRPKTMAWQRDVYAFKGVGGLPLAGCFLRARRSNTKQQQAATGSNGAAVQGREEWDIYAYVQRDVYVWAAKATR